jgi:hypothetical protein
VKTWELEAVLLTDDGPWHAVDPLEDNLTFCGRSVLRAKIMWERWTEKQYGSGRCKTCEKVLRNLAESA